MFLTPDEIVLSLLVADSAQESPSFAPVRMRLVGSSTTQLRGEERRPGVAHYYRGSDPSTWVRDVPSFVRVRYERVYPGVDLLISLERGYPRYDFHVAPGADPDAIRIRFGGAGTLALLPDGSLQVHSRGGELRHSRPVLYQEVDGQRVFVHGSFRLEGRDLAIQVGDYDSSRPLVIHPTITYSGLIGGSGSENTGDDLDIASDGADKIYLTGSTWSADFPVTDASVYRGNQDAYVMRLSASNPALLVPEFTTYLGSSGYDEAKAVDVDAQGNAVVVGYTTSFNLGTPADFPLENAIQTAFGGDHDGFLVRISPDGFLLQSTFIGGDQDDRAYGVDAASDGIYIVGSTSSPSFAFAASTIAHGPQGSRAGLVLKLAPDGTAAEYLAFLRGSRTTEVNDVAVSGGEAVVVGAIDAVDFPVVSELYPCLNNHPDCLQHPSGPTYDAFVTRLSADGQRLLFSTWIGAYSTDRANGVEIDPLGSIVVVGSTSHANLVTPIHFPTTAGALQRSPGGMVDGFLAKFSENGALEYGTYLGGPAWDDIYDLDVDDAGRIVLTGSTRSGSGMLTTPPLDTQYPGGYVDAVLMVLQPDGNALQVAQWFPLGGTRQDVGTGAAAGGDAAYVGGWTMSPDFWSSSGDDEFNGPSDHFVVRFEMDPVPVGQLGLSIDAAPEPIPVTQEVTYTIAVSNSGTVAVREVTADGVLSPDEVIEPLSVSSPDGACELVHNSVPHPSLPNETREPGGSEEPVRSENAEALAGGHRASSGNEAEHPAPLRAANLTFQCTLGVLPAQGSATVTLVGQGRHVRPAQLEVTARGADHGPVTASFSSTLVPYEADLALTGRWAPSGQSLLIELEVTNNGPANVRWVQVRTSIQGHSLVGWGGAEVVDENGGSCAVTYSAAAMGVLCTVRDLTAGETIPLQIRVNAGSGVFWADVGLSGDHSDPTPENNTLRLSVEIQP